MGEELKEAIVSYYQRKKEENGGLAPFMQSMAEIFGVKRPTVFYIIDKFKKTGSVTNLPKGHKKSAQQPVKTVK